MDKLFSIQIVLFTLGGLLASSLYFWASYVDHIRNSSWFLWLGCLVLVVEHVLWVNLARYLGEPRSIMMGALVWDIIILSTGWLIPLLFFKVRLGMYGYLGLVMIVAGAVILKMNSYSA